MALRWNAIAFFLVLIVFLVVRYRIALAARMRETTVPERRSRGARQAVVVMSTLETVLAAVGEGRIQGGWEYVWTAYGIAWTGLVALRAVPLGRAGRGRRRK